MTLARVPGRSGGTEWQGQVFQRPAFGVDTEESLDQASGDHDSGADEVADEQLVVVVPLPISFP